MSVDAAVEEQFGPYLVYERLGVGGMATVHRALEQNDGGFERTVALKRLLPHLAEDASFIKSFVREAKLASILSHVNIVQIYELGRVGTEYFISMEYIEGRDLRRVLRHARKVTGPPPIDIAVGLMIQLCDALDYAHNKVDEDGHPLGLVHRDISPSNLLLTSGGHLKIIDFGIAKAQSSQLRTQTGRVKGKLAYMAPEAISGSRDLDARSDLWATGVILHELITARPLFASKNEYQTLLKVQSGELSPPSVFNETCPPELDAVVLRALARDPDQRFSTAAELREALLAVEHEYSMRTGFREIATWVEWAFRLEDDSAARANEPLQHQKTPRPPRNTEEDEAVEVVWGGGARESEDGPVVLDEVPDVSEKHHRSRRDTEDDRAELDDIPTPVPSRDTLPSIYIGPSPIVAPSSVPNRSSAPASGSKLGTESVPIWRPVTAEMKAITEVQSFGDDAMDALATVAQSIGEANDDDVATLTDLPAQKASSPAPIRTLPATKPGVAPVNALLAPHPTEPRRSKAPSNVVIGASIAARAKPNRTWLVMLVGLGVAAATAIAVAWAMT